MSPAIPLILQIQTEALDTKASLGAALLKAKVACAKLNLASFGRWVEGELGGYKGDDDTVPEYRKLRGSLQAMDAYGRWNPVAFAQQDWADALTIRTVHTPIGTLEDQLSRETGDGLFSMSFGVRQQAFLREQLPYGRDFRLAVDPGHMRVILDRVRNVLVDWTIKMEAEGVTGAEAGFTPGQKIDAEKATASVINTFNIASLGALVQSSPHAQVQGTVNHGLDLVAVTDLVGQIRAQQAALPSHTWTELEPRLLEIEEELKGRKRPDVIRKGLGVIKDLCGGVTANLAASGIVHLIGPLLAVAATGLAG